MSNVPPGTKAIPWGASDGDVAALTVASVADQLEKPAMATPISLKPITGSTTAMITREALQGTHPFWRRRLIPGDGRGFDPRPPLSACERLRRL